MFRLKITGFPEVDESNSSSKISVSPFGEIPLAADASGCLWLRSGDEGEYDDQDNGAIV